MSKPVKITLVLNKETKGAVRLHEVDDKGNERLTDADKAVVGTQYFRKAQLPDGKVPTKIIATYEYFYG